MKQPRGRRIFIAIFCLTAFAFTIIQPAKPTVYLIGDSTVKNGAGKGDGGLWGWGNFLPAEFDTTRISISNAALGGRSSRTYLTEGKWQDVFDKLKPGDYVLMQFGHNDSGPLDDTARARGTIKGISDESKEIFNPITKKKEVVHTYGWYLKKFISDIKSRSATAIVCSPIPRNGWKEGKVNRAGGDYGKWAKDVAAEVKVEFIDLNNLIADDYDKEGEAIVVKNYFGPTDHTHTIKAGAELNAKMVAKGISELKGNLKNYLKKN